MNLENRDKANVNYEDDYAQGDFAEYEESETGSAPAESPKMHRILSELNELKNNVAATMSAPAPQSAPARTDDALVSEINRLREENIRAQTSQEINAQLARMKEELTRELRGGSAPVSGTDSAVLQELRRLGERVDSIDTRRHAAYGAPAAYAYPASAEQDIDERLLDDINAKLAHLDTQIGEISVMTMANDLTPIAKTVNEIKEKIEASAAATAAEDGGERPEYEDRLLDELVRVQNTVEEMKKTLDDMTATEPFDENEQVVQDNLFSAKQLDRLDDLQQEISSGIHTLNEQIAAMHADMKIYAEDGAFVTAAPAADGELHASELGMGTAQAAIRKIGELEDALTALSTRMLTADVAGDLTTQIKDLRAELLLQSGTDYEEKLDALGASLDDIKLQLATGIVAAAPEEESQPEPEPVAHDYDNMVLDALAEVRFRLDELRTEIGDMTESRTAASSAPAVVDRTDEILGAVHGLADLYAPVDLVPLVNTMTELDNPDLSPVLQAVAELARKVDALSSRSAVEAPISASAETQTVAADPAQHREIMDAIASLSARVDAMPAPIAPAPHDDTAVLQAIAQLREEIADARALRPTADEIRVIVREELERIMDEMPELTIVTELAEPVGAENPIAAVLQSEQIAVEEPAPEVEEDAESDPVAAQPAAAAQPEPVAAAEAEEAVSAEELVEDASQPEEAVVAAEQPAEEAQSEEGSAKDAEPEATPTPKTKPAPNQTPAPRRGAPKKSGKKPAPKLKASKIVLNDGDALANQVSHAIALTQLRALGADKVGKTRTRRVLAVVEAESRKEIPFEANDFSIRRNANRIVIANMLDARHDED